MTTAATTTNSNSSTFPQFASLPPELRSQIWRDALPNKDRPAIYPYRTGCWIPRQLSRTEEGYDPVNTDCNTTLEFRHELLDYVQVKLPLVLVNCEARAIALAWAREQGIKMRFLKGRQCHILARPFDPARDTLYVALDKIGDWCSEPDDRMFQPDVLGKTYSWGMYPTRIALSEALFRGEEDPALGELFDWFTRPTVVYIIVDAQLGFEDNDVKVQRRWELESNSQQGKAFFYNPKNRGFDLGDGEYIGDESLYRRIEEACKDLSDVVASNFVESFEIQPVLAARR